MLVSDELADSVDSLVSEHVRLLEIPDLDTTFRLKIGTMVAEFLPAMYGDFAKHIDVAGLRGRGLASAITFAEFERLGGPLAVAAPLHSSVQTRHCELSGAGLGQPGARLGFECLVGFSSPPGSGDPLRYRDIIDERPVPCGRARIILTLIRPFGPPAARLVTEPQQEIRNLRVQVLDEAHPRVESLSMLPPAFTECSLAAPERHGVFGRHNTDINQYVFTGDYVAVLEDYVTLLVADAGLDAAAHQIDRVAAVLKSPFAAGAPYTVRGSLHRNGDRTLTLAGIHAAGQSSIRPAVFARIEGICTQ